MSKMSNQRKGRRQNWVFLVGKENRKKRVLQTFTRIQNKFSKESCRKTKQGDNERPRKKKFKKGEKRWTKRQNTERQKKDNKTREEEAKEEIKRQRRHSKRKNVEKVFLGGKSEEIKKGSCKLSKHNFSMIKQFFCEEEKNRKKEKTQRNIYPFEKMRRRNTWETPFLFSKKKGDSKNGKNSKKSCFCWKNWSMKKWENKKMQKKDNQIKGNLHTQKKSKRTFKMKKQRRNRCSRKRTKQDQVQKQRRKTNWKKKDREKGQTCKNKEIWKSALPKSKKSKKCRNSKYLSLQEVIDRENKKEKENKCGRKEKTRREKRDNRWTNGWTKGGHKEVSHACKRDNSKNDIKRKGIVVHKLMKVKVMKTEFKKKKIKKIERSSKMKDEKRRTSKKNKTMFLRECEDYWKTFSNENSNTFKNPEYGGIY